MDYTNSIAAEIGFKYRPTRSVAYFLKGNLSTEKPIPFNGVNYSSQEYRTYGATVGIEYGVYSIDKISFYVVLAGRIKISDYVLPYFAELENDVHMLFIDDRHITYSFTTGLGGEYFFSKHLSVGCIQTLSFEHNKGMVYSDEIKPVSSSSSIIHIGYTKFTLSFYF